MLVIHQRRHRPRAGHAAQLVAIDLGHDLHDAPINRVALTGQLRQLLKQHLKTLARTDHHGATRCGRRHDIIIAATYDKSGPPDPHPRNSAPTSPAHAAKQHLNPLPLPRIPE